MCVLSGLLPQDKGRAKYLQLEISWLAKSQTSGLAKSQTLTGASQKMLAQLCARDSYLSDNLNISEMRLRHVLSTWARPVRKKALSTCNDAVTSGGSGSPLSSAEDPRLPLDVSATVGGGGQGTEGGRERGGERGRGRRRERIFQKNTGAKMKEFMIYQ